MYLKHIARIVLIAIVAVALAHAYPSPHTRVTKSSPAFFADEFYQAEDAKTLNEEIEVIETNGEHDEE